ncbi:AAA domain-containing protein [uncultured Helicobacter sp.]|uniref:AAA domain-containing protein n=1 Tax=uncultured Helicobacter sp. TaxID=175537 RepID=UPI00374F0437
MDCVKTPEEILVDSAQSYYVYLDEHNLGLEELKIVSATLEQERLILALGGRLFSQDGLVLQVREKLFELSVCADMQYNQESFVLEISPNYELLESLQRLQNSKSKKSSTHKISPENLKLFSDLKFLVRNVEDFVAKHSLTLPSRKPIAPPQIPSYLNDYQKNALDMLFSQSLSYVWGAPGSGKTQVVLFEAVYHYAKQGLKTCVLAPTNSALEQIFITLITHFKQMDFELSNLLRLGMPTQKFLSLYPECCDPNLLIQRGQTSLFAQPISLKNRLKDAHIIGLTLDGFIKKSESLEVEFAHYFLDECAFAPLAKACALCADNVPITFFGDHKQLMPICEMPPKELKIHKEVNVWNLSALFLEEFFHTPQSVLEKQPTDTPALSHIAELKFTHRYGDNLAQILDSAIYGIGLRGRDERMEIYCIDSGAKGEAQSNVSQNEALAIYKLYKYLHQKSLTQSLGIITPFVNQKKLLGRMIAHNDISTIHGSQGREWENVIFSPVGLHYYLTDSRQINALFGLNVAISRLKKRLFIVCDLGFWQQQEGQFLHALLTQSTRINL